MRKNIAKNKIHRTHLCFDTIVPGKTQCRKTDAAVLRVYYYAGEISKYKSRMLI